MGEGVRVRVRVRTMECVEKIAYAMHKPTVYWVRVRVEDLGCSVQGVGCRV